MQKVIGTEKRPIKLWLSDIEPSALAQAKNLANLPFTFRHVAIMPDAHCGYGMPIGGVLATKNAVIPNAVGVDIGCGMCAVQTSLQNIERETLKAILGSQKEGHGIRARIPFGFRHQKRAQDTALLPDLARLDAIKNSRVRDQYQAARKQIGTLGGGNHFIEIQQGNDGHIWIMVHSGSRNIGLQVAQHYNRLAKKLNARWHTGIPSKWDLAFLPLDSEEGQAYLLEMQYCVDFALANRMVMMEQIKQVFSEVIDDFTGSADAVNFADIINIAHNYAAIEQHFGEEVVVHRKGAIRARRGEKGIIPGSQGTQSFIVSGLGNPESFSSCSHGAGRVLGRKQAQKTLHLAQEQQRLDKMGILHDLRSKFNLDEAPSAYKDINKVMNNQQDLVDILLVLRPLAVMKG